MSMRIRAAWVVFVAGTLALGLPQTVAAELLPLSCDDSVGASAGLFYLDSSPEFEEQDEFGECGTAPVGTWARVSYADDTSAATVDASAEASSADGFVLEAANDLFLDVDGGFLDFASVGVGLVVEGLFEAPAGAGEVSADLVVEIVRSGDELEDALLALVVIGPGVGRLERELDDEPAGVIRIPVDLEPNEEYRAILTADAALTESGAGFQAVRFSVDAEPVPEPAGALLVAVGGLVLAAGQGARRRRVSASSRR